jgi:hypothetical protein
MENNPGYKSLIEMGISDVLATAAIRQLKTENVDPLLDWIEKHGE